MPTAELALTLGPVALLWSIGCLHMAGHARQRGWAVGYTRKLFHVCIFLTAAGVHVQWGLAGVCVLGGAVSLALLHALLRGDGHAGYEALARPEDAPRRTHFIVAPYLATLAGGLGANLFFGHYAIAGYLVTGLADAAAEPVGHRWGKHRYRVPSAGGVTAVRSLEGSGAVALVSGAMLALAAWLVGTDATPAYVATLALAGAAASALVEAVSPHGWDNLTLQWTASGVLWMGLG